jgi:hypothetical protein
VCVFGSVVHVCVWPHIGVLCMPNATHGEGWYGWSWGWGCVLPSTYILLCLRESAFASDLLHGCVFTKAFNGVSERCAFDIALWIVA